MQRYSLVEEPRDQDYRDLVHFCGVRASTAILVVRELDWLEEEAIDQFADRLPSGKGLHEALVPMDLTYRGVVRGNFDDVPSRGGCQEFRVWGIA